MDQCFHIIETILPFLLYFFNTGQFKLQQKVAIVTMMTQLDFYDELLYSNLMEDLNSQVKSK